MSRPPLLRSCSGTILPSGPQKIAVAGFPRRLPRRPEPLLPEMPLFIAGWRTARHSGTTPLLLPSRVRILTLRHRPRPEALLVAGQERLA